jgi:hypothetical protein
MAETTVFAVPATPGIPAVWVPGMMVLQAQATQPSDRAFMDNREEPDMPDISQEE